MAKSIFVWLYRSNRVAGRRAAEVMMLGTIKWV